MFFKTHGMISHTRCPRWNPCNSVRHVFLRFLSSPYHRTIKGLAEGVLSVGVNAVLPRYTEASLYVIIPLTITFDAYKLLNVGTQLSYIILSVCRCCNVLHNYWKYYHKNNLETPRDLCILITTSARRYHRPRNYFFLLHSFNHHDLLLNLKKALIVYGTLHWTILPPHILLNSHE